MPTLVQRIKNLNAVAQVTAETHVSVPGLGQRIKESGVAAAVEQVSAAARIQSLAGEFPYAMWCVAIKKRRKKEKKRKRQD